MAMTVGELMDRLSELDENLEVAIVVQPSYPLTHEVSDRHFFIDDRRVYLYEGDESWYAGEEGMVWR